MFEVAKSGRLGDPLVVGFRVKLRLGGSTLTPGAALCPTKASNLKLRSAGSGRTISGSVGFPVSWVGGGRVALVYPVWLRNLSTCSELNIEIITFAMFTLSLKSLYGMSSSGLATSAHTGHRLPSLSMIPFLAHSSHAEPAQGGLANEPDTDQLHTCTARHHHSVLQQVLADGAEQFCRN